MKNTKKIKEALQYGVYDDTLLDIYVDSSMIDHQRARYLSAVEEFEKNFGVRDVELFSAPGRSEVGGNHTDHQHGMVLATSVNLDAIAVATVNTEDNTVKVMSDGYGMVVLEADDLEKKEEESGTTAGLIRGVLKGLKSKGYESKGFVAYITSNVLGGAGLSSSAAFETMIGTIVSGLFYDMKINSIDIAKIGQYAENVYFDKPCGLMDQMACSVGGLIHIDFKDPKKPEVERLDVDFSKYHHSLCIVDTKGSHADLTDEYAAIPMEMKRVAEYFGEEVLRDVDEKEFVQKIAELREKLGDRAVLRSLHFFEEEKKVMKEVNALKEQNFEGFLNTIKESGNSSFKYLQNVYSNKDVDSQAVSIGLSISDYVLSGHGVSRVHGGGFAGTIQAFVEDDFVEEYRKAMDAVFGEGACHVLKVRPYGGIKVVE